MAHLRSILLLSLAGSICAASVCGQILMTQGPLPSFEVASIKPWKASVRPTAATVPVKMDPVHRVQSLESSRVHFIGQVDLLLMDAYNLPIGSERRIMKAPRWAESESDRYEIVARIDPVMFAAMKKMTPEQQREQVQRMEQSLLAERFHLRAHRETRGQAPVYALVVDKTGPKITPARTGEESRLSALRNEITAQAVTLDEFARSPLWTPIGERFVVNQTGLTGSYDFSLRWRSDDLEEAGTVQGGSDLPYLFDAIWEQLGLKVVDAKAPLEVLVIDHIERPSEN